MSLDKLSRTASSLGVRSLAKACRRLLAARIGLADLRPLASSIHWKGWA
jgi:hypothetical protein